MGGGQVGELVSGILQGGSVSGLFTLGTFNTGVLGVDGINACGELTESLGSSISTGGKFGHGMCPESLSIPGFQPLLLESGLRLGFGLHVSVF